MSKWVNLWTGVFVLILFISGVPGIQAQDTSETASVIIAGTVLYAEPDEQSAQLAALAVDELLMVDEVLADGQWVQVTTADGTVGWVLQAAIILNGPYLPPADGYTRTALNRLDGWERFYQPYLDETGDAVGMFDLEAVRAFMNDQYAYILLEGAGDVQAVDLLLLDIVAYNGGEYSTYQYAQPRSRTGTLFAITEEAGVARNAATVRVYWADEGLVFRLPLDLIGLPDTLNLVAVSLQTNDGTGLQVVDELRTVMAVVATREVEPPLDSQIGDYAVNIRDAPLDGQIMRTLAPETSFSLLGRSTDGSWVLVRLADGFAGWVAEEYVETSADVSTLTVTE